MESQETIKKKQERVLIKKCHICGELIESREEIKKCPKCHKSFLPSNYFTKIHVKNSNEFKNLFLRCEELNEEDLIKGIMVIW